MMLKTLYVNAADVTNLQDAGDTYPESLRFGENSFAFAKEVQERESNADTIQIAVYQLVRIDEYKVSRKIEFAKETRISG